MSQPTPETGPVRVVLVEPTQDPAATPATAAAPDGDSEP